MEDQKETIELFRGIQPPHLAFYSQAIRFNLESAIYSVEFIVNALKEADTEEKLSAATDEILDAIQSMLVHTASLAKYFWETNKGLHNIHRKRAQNLREMFNVSDASAIKDKNLRNHLEHLDENLDKYLWSKPIVGNIFPAYVGPEMPRGAVPYHFFRAFFTDSGTFESLGLRFEIQPIVVELYDLYRGSFGESNT
jgi:hypothetical protein|tara:strand:+ start:21 stop:608 length:588 start_codon:yes stop_codon:yes gene_type:complete